MRFLRAAALLGATCAIVLALGAGSAFATTPDPSKVSFTLEGCRLQAGQTLPINGKFVCPDADYTTGNLGKLWNELDLVPFRITADNGGNAQTYAVAIALDSYDAGHPGYDVIGSDGAGGTPVLNTNLSSGSCAISSTPQQTLEPGVGGIDRSIYRILTITQGAGAKCVFDWYGRLALGSHLFPGSSLHADLLNQQLGTAGIGAKDVSIPVKEIQPQELDKTMQATQGASYTWSISKDATPTLDFANTCDPNAAHSAGVTVTVTWRRLAPSPTGDITVVTDITVTNPAHRSIVANVTDTVKSGTTPVAALTGSNPKVFNPVTVAANSSTTLHNTLTVASGTLNLNDVATATYTDVATGIDVPGNTTATASANVQTSNISNDTATITDVESISGDGLSFSVDSVTGAPAGSAFANYTEGTPTTHPVTWNSGTIDPGSGTTDQSGTITFNKTVYVDGSRDISDGSLSDVATLTDSGSNTHQASASTAITATSNCASVRVVKTEAGATPSGSWGFELIGGPNDVDLTGTADAGNGGVVDFGELPPGDYTLCELNVPDGWHSSLLQDGGTVSGSSVCIELTLAPGDAVEVPVNNVHPLIAIAKSGPATATAGDTLNYTLDVTNPGNEPLVGSTIAVNDPRCDGAPQLQSKNGDPSPDTLDPGDKWTYTCSASTHVGETSVHNVATVSGCDRFDNCVNAQATLDTTLSQPQLILPERIVPGTARLLGPTGCRGRAFTARVAGTRIAKVRFVLDGRTIKVLAKPNKRGQFAVRINPNRLRIGIHRLVARVTFEPASQTKPKTFRLSFQRCARRFVPPRFTG